MARRYRAFTLVELLTVAFILAVMIALMLPAIQRIKGYAMKKKTEQIIAAIRGGIRSYEQELGSIPPSEPDKTNSSSNTCSSGTTGYGGAALLHYLNGYDGNGLVITQIGGGARKNYDPRVNGVQVSPGNGFLDAWGNEIEYFVAYRERSAWRTNWPRPNPGETTADAYPRACNADLGGNSSAGYNQNGVKGGGTTPGQDRGNGIPIRVPITRWLDDSYSPDTTQPPKYNKPPGYVMADPSSPNNVSGWQTHSVPQNIGAGGYLLISPGPDAIFGTSDDCGDVGAWSN